MNLRFSRRAAVALVVGACMLGLGAGTAGASPLTDALGGGSSSGSLGGSLPTSNYDKVRLGNVGGPVWAADVHLQPITNPTVAPGGQVTIRVEINGTRGEAKIRQLQAIMPDEFRLVSVKRVKGGLLGDSVYTLKTNEYADTVNNGRRVVTVSWKEGGFLGLFQDNPTVSQATPLMVDFTWQAPGRVGEFETGAGATVGALINPTESWNTGGPKVVVANGGGSGSAGSGSAGGRNVSVQDVLAG